MAKIDETEKLQKERHELIRKIDDAQDNGEESEANDLHNELKKLNKKISRIVEKHKKKQQARLEEEIQQRDVDPSKVYKQFNKYYDTVVAEYRNLQDQVKDNVKHKKHLRGIRSKIKDLKDKEQISDDEKEWLKTVNIQI